MTEREPASAVYNAHPDKVGLRIATGGSGQSGLLQELARAFIKDCVAVKKVKPFLIEWYKSDTTYSIMNLKNKVADVAITYHAVAEKTAIDTGIADRVEYAWRDHWMLVGPKSNLAGLPENSQETIFSLFTKLFSAMEETKESEKPNHENSEKKKPIKFLSRYDKSAGNIVESLLWATIGQVPWADKQSSWYHSFPSFPFQALREAAKEAEYTITDKGTWLSIEEQTRSKLTVFAEGKDDENDPLLNPAHVLVGTNAENKQTANEFADWMKEGGQEVIKTFKQGNKVAYSTIPKGVCPLDRVKGTLGFAPDHSTATSGQVKPGLHLLEAEHSQQLLSLDDSKTANGAFVQTYESSSSNANQQWQIASAGNDEYFILANETGTYVTSPTRDGYEVTGNFISPTDKRARWKFVEAGNGAYYIYSVAFPKSVLDVRGSGRANKTSVLTYTFTGNPNQKWRVKPVQYAVYL